MSRSSRAPRINTRKTPVIRKGPRWLLSEAFRSWIIESLKNIILPLITSVSLEWIFIDTMNVLTVVSQSV